MHNTAKQALSVQDGLEAKDGVLHTLESIKNLFGLPIDNAPARLKNSLHEAIMVLIEQENFEDHRPIVEDLGELYHFVNALEGCEDCYWTGQDTEAD